MQADRFAGLDAALRWLSAGRWRARLVLVLVALAIFLPGFANLPVTEWDEARYVQATSQMVASGDLIDIRFQDGPRHKKPVGIYWLQTAAVTIFGDGAETPIWVYRLPSLAAAVLAVVLTHVIVAPLAGPGVAFVAALLMAAGPILGGEARLAKTDAALLAATLAAMAVLLRAYMAARASPGSLPPDVVPPWPEALKPLPVAAPGRLMVLGFWLALGAGILIKGPITPLVVGLAALALCWPARGAGWMRPLGWWPAPVIALALTLPWFVAITIVSGGEFWTASVMDDLLAKVAEGVESKGFWPGYYTFSLPLAFWPAMLLILPLLPRLWKLRRHPAVPVALCWILPTWIVFELTPTKLVHYTLPVYAAIAMLAGLALLGRPEGARGRGLRVSAVIYTLVVLGLLAGVGGFLWQTGAGVAWEAALAAAVVLGVAVALWAALGADRRFAAVAMVVVMAGVAHAAVFTALGRAPFLWASAAAAQALEAHAPCPDSRLFALGYDEPALVFLRNGDLARTDAAGLAEVLAQDACAIGLVEAEEEEGWIAAATAAGLSPEPVARVEGIAIGIGTHVRLAILRPALPAAVPGDAPGSEGAADSPAGDPAEAPDAADGEAAPAAEDPAAEPAEDG